MKKLVSMLSMTVALAISFNIVTTIPVHAQVGLYWIDNNSFLERDTTYYFGLYDGDGITNAQVKYHCQPLTGTNTNFTVDVASYTLDSPIYWLGGGSFNTASIQNYGPWYNSGFLKNRLDFTVTHPDNTTSTTSINCDVLAKSTSWYEDRDSTIYYNTPTNNSFISFKTGNYSNFGDYAIYNCLSYSIHAESEGWLWPFGDYATNAAVVYYLDGKGYTQNTTTNHSFCHVIAYGSNNNIAHFAKVTDWASDGTPIEINSKWGGLEVIHSSSTAPFTSAISYGNPILYFNKSSNNTASICYNSTTNTYYDSNYKTWDPYSQTYHYIDVLFPSSSPQSTPESEMFCSDELAQIYNKYTEKITAYAHSIPDFDSISYVITDDENGAADELITESIPYFDQVFDIATQSGYKNFDARTAQFIITNALHLNVFYSTPNEYLCDVQEQLKAATNAVKAYGSNISRADCNELQEKYGYLIAPALQDIGKLEYLSLEKTDACQDIDKLIKLCHLFE